MTSGTTGRAELPILLGALCREDGGHEVDIDEDKSLSNLDEGEGGTPHYTEAHNRVPQYKGAPRRNHFAQKRRGVNFTRG